MKRRKFHLNLSQIISPKVILASISCLLLLTFCLYWNLSFLSLNEGSSSMNRLRLRSSELIAEELAQNIVHGLLQEEEEEVALKEPTAGEDAGVVIFTNNEDLDNSGNFDPEGEVDNDDFANSESYLRRAGLRISARIARVKSTCQKYHLGEYNHPGNSSNDLGVKDLPTPQYAYFFYNRDRNLSWCPVYKAGSTSWLWNMMLLAGLSEETLSSPPKQLSILARETYGDDLDEDTLKNSFKFLVVRHPFERLVSAYRDKLSNASIGLEHGTEHFYKKYGRKIVLKFREKGSPVTSKEPTFSEFVDYLLDTDLVYMDDHWIPAYYTCTPCHLEYDVIGKTETYMRDQEYLINSANLNVSPRWQHSSSNKGTLQSTSKIYFAQLTRSQILRLYQKYFLDFELFGYDHKEYLDWAKD